MAKPGGVVDMIGPHESSCLLGHVIDLIGHPSCCHEKGTALRRSVLKMLSKRLERLIPADTMKPGLPLEPPHGVCQPPKGSQLSIGFPLEFPHVLKDIGRHGWHGIEPEQIEASHTQMNPLNGPIVQARYAKGASIAYPSTEDFPCVRKIVLVLPGNLEHVPKVFGLVGSNTER